MTMADHKMMTASLRIRTMKEMSSKVRGWVNDDPALRKLFAGHIEFSRDVALDPQRWNPGALSTALHALVRYELKLLDDRAQRLLKDHGKADDRGKKAIVRKLSDEFGTLADTMQQKCCAALEELEAGTGGSDARKNVRDGASAMKRLEAMNVDRVFATPRGLFLSALRALNADLWEAEDVGASDQPGPAADTLRANAFWTARRHVGAAQRSFAGDSDDAEEAVHFLIRTAGEIHLNGAAHAPLVNFANTVDGEDRALRAFLKALADFHALNDRTVAAVTGGQMTSKDAQDLESAYLDAAAMDKAGSMVQSAVVKLKRAFAAVEKELQ